MRLSAIKVYRFSGSHLPAVIKLIRGFDLKVGLSNTVTASQTANLIVRLSKMMYIIVSPVKTVNDKR